MSARPESLSLTRRMLIVPPILMGIALIFVAMASKKPPARQEGLETSQRVRIVQAVSGKISPDVIGYGLIRPGRLWEAVAQVAGPVAWVHPKLKSGTLLPKGTDLIHIDPAEYEAALAQAEAERAGREVKLRSTRASLAIEEQAVGLLKTDLERKRTLASRGTVSGVAVETAERALLSAQTKAQALRNVLAETQADIKVLEARIATAKLAVARTRITAPFDLRINQLLVEVSQYATRGAVLLKADGTQSAEVTAHIPAGRMGPLVRGTGGPGWMLDGSGVSAAGPLGLKATVVLRRGSRVITWSARVSRIAESVDPQTQTIGVIVSVDRPYELAEPGKRPPLAPNTFVEVELRGAKLENQIVIPVAAVRTGRVYIVTKDSRLEIRPVRLAFRHGRFAVVSEGVAAGERVVVSDLVPAIKGMLLDPILDQALMQSLRQFSDATPGHQGGER